MTGTIKLAWRYIQYHKFKSLILIACLFLTVFLPIVIGLLLTEFNRKIVARADSTPAVVGATGANWT